MPQFKNRMICNNCKSNPVFFVCATIACYDGNNPKQHVFLAFRDAKKTRKQIPRPKTFTCH